MSANKDIEYEMSRFEAELSKLETTTKNTASVPIKHKISIQMPTSLPSSGSSSVQAHSSNSLYAQSYPVPQHPTSSLAKANQPHKLPQKRDSSGMLKTAANTAAANAFAVAEMENKGKKSKLDKKKKKMIRCAGGQTWEDESLADWDPDDFRLFCGDLGNEVTDDALARAFQKYTSFQKAKVIRDKRTGKSKGYGFVSFKSSEDFIKAMREMNGKYVGNRPIKLRKSTWKERNIEIVKKKEHEKHRMGFK